MGRDYFRALGQCECVCVCVLWVCEELVCGVPVKPREGRTRGPRATKRAKPRAMTALADLFKAREVADPEQRNQLLRNVVAQLVKTHLRQSPAFAASATGLSTADDVSRILMILGHLATKQMGAFGWGEPAAVGPTLLGLIEQLPYPSEARQDAVVATLQQVLTLLRVGSARAIATLGTEAMALIETLSEQAVDTLRPRQGLVVYGFHALASQCRAAQGEDESDAPAPAALRLETQAHLSWLRLGLLRLCTMQVHTGCTHFSRYGSPGLWDAALDCLQVPASQSPTAAQRSTTPQPPSLIIALQTVHTMLEKLGAPPPVQSDLLRRLLLVLTADLPPYDETQQPVIWPHFRTKALDDILGDCLALLIRPNMPPLECLSLLEIAVPHALASSASTRLHTSLCAIMQTLPVESIDGHLRQLEALLARPHLRAALVPCFEHAFASASADDEIPPPTDIGVGDHDERRPKRRRLARLSSRQRLFATAMRLEMGSSTNEDVRSLGLLGTATLLFAPVTEHAAHEDDGGDIARFFTPLLAKLQHWLDSILRMASENPEAAGSAWDGNSTEESLMATAFDVCDNLLQRVTRIDLPDSALATISSLAALPWSHVNGVVEQHHVHRFAAPLRSAALRLLAAHGSSDADSQERSLRAYTHAIESCQLQTPSEIIEGTSDAPMLVEASQEELDVGSTALLELPTLISSSGMACTRMLTPLRKLGHACPQSMCAAYADCLGHLACIDSGQLAEDGCKACDLKHNPDHAAPSNAGGEDEDTSAGAGAAAVNATVGERLFSLVPLLWDQFNALAEDDEGAHAAIVESISRLARHARPLELARARETLVPFLSLLSEDDPRTRAACEACFPRLLAYEPFVRAVTAYPEQERFSPATLISTMVEPIADAMRNRSDEPEVQRTIIRVLGALGAEPLYAPDECRAAIVSVLSELLSVDTQPSAAHSLSLQLIDTIARAQQHTDLAASEASGAAGPAQAAAQPRTIAGLCRRLAKHLAPQWIWWLVDNPLLLSAIARSLFDTDEATCLKLLAPRAVPRIVLVGSLGMADEGTPSAARLSVPGHTDYTALATTVLKELARQLGTTSRALLVDHMHLVLAEIFTEQAGDTPHQILTVAPKFMYALGIPRSEDLGSMITMSARELFQEMVQRLGTARTEPETATVVMALNLLLPFGLNNWMDSDSASLMTATSRGGAASLISSLDVTRGNKQLVEYIDANAMMLLDFLRRQLSSRHATSEDKAVALHALHQLLRILEADGSVPQWWWGEMVATLTMSLKQPALQAQALAVIRTFVSLLQEEQLARGLQQLVLMLLPCLPSHPRAVVRILEALVIHPADEPPSEPLTRALGELTFLPSHPQLERVHAALARYAPRSRDLRDQLRQCSRGVVHESRAVRAMAARQLLETIHPADPSLNALLLSTDPSDVVLVSELLHRLLQCAHESHNAAAAAPSAVARDELVATAECALQCLGQMGAHDPAKIHTPSSAASGGVGQAGGGGGGQTGGGSAGGEGGSSSSKTLFATADIESDTSIAASLLEGPLLRMMRSASEGHVPAAAYATMMLLQHVCMCNVETPSLLPIKMAHDEAIRRGSLPPDRWKKLSREQQAAINMWGRLAEGTRHAVVPYLSLKAEQAEAARFEAPPIYRDDMAYSEWVVRWCRHLLAVTASLRDVNNGSHLDATKRRRATLLFATYTCVRYDAGLALALLPLAIVFLLTAMPEGAIDAPESALPIRGRPALIENLLREIEAVLHGGDQAEHLLCCEALFEIIDRLSDVRAHHRKHEGEAAHVTAIDALLGEISALQLAKAAVRAGSYCRAIRYAEVLADSSESSKPQPRHFTNPGQLPRELPTSEATSLMHRAYLQTDEPDGLLALARMRTQGTLSEEDALAEEALEHEIHGRFSAALNCYQIALQAPPPPPPQPHARAGAAAAAATAAAATVDSAAAHGGENNNPQAQPSTSQVSPRQRARSLPTAPSAAGPSMTRLSWQLGLCRSLRNLGLVVTMRDSAAAAFRQAQTALERSQLLPCVVQAAWRLGQWDDVRALLSDDGRALPPASSLALATAPSPPDGRPTIMQDDLYEVELANALLSMHDGRVAAISQHCTAARRALIPQIAAAGMDSYSRAYGGLIKLHALQEVQAAAPLLQAILRVGRDQQTGERPEEIVASLGAMVGQWTDRASLVADAPQFLEPILAIRTAILRMADHAISESVMDSAGRCGGGGGGGGVGVAEMRSLTSGGLSQTWLRFAKSARAAGHSETAGHALAQAAVHDSYSAGLVAAKMAWEGGKPHEAILRLQQQVRSLRSQVPTTCPAPNITAAELTAKTLIRLARYTEEQVGDAETDEIRKMHSEAMKLCPAWEKAHYYHGRFFDNVLMRYLATARRKEVPRQGGAGLRSTVTKTTVKKSDWVMKQLQEYGRFLPEVIRSYAHALKKGMRHSALALSRMLSLWLDFADLQLEQSRSGGGGGQGARQAGATGQAEKEEKCHHQMETAIATVPTYQWLPEVAQLVSRSTHGNTRVRTLIHKLLVEMLSSYPAQLSWSIVPAALSTVAERRKHGETIVAAAKHKLIAINNSEVLSIAKRLIDQLRKVCNDNTMEKRDKYIRMSARWATLYG